MTMQPSPACPPARDAPWTALFFMVYGLASLLAIAWAQGVSPLDPQLSRLRESTFYTIFYVHAWVALYDGCFSRLRRATWPALIGVAFALQTLEFLGPSLSRSRSPSAWFAATLTGWHVPVDAAFGILAAAPLALLVLDVMAMQEQRLGRSWRTIRSGWPGTVAEALVMLGAVWFLFGLPQEATSVPFRSQIVLPWHSLPYQAMLRLVPDKLTAAATVVLALAAPLIWPWVGAAWCRTGPARHAYRAMCAGLIAAWVLMGWSGAQFPDPVPIALGRLGTATSSPFSPRSPFWPAGPAGGRRPLTGYSGRRRALRRRPARHPDLPAHG